MFSRGYASELYDDDSEDMIGVPSFHNLAGVRTLLFFFALVIKSHTRKFKVHTLTWMNTCSHAKTVCTHTHIYSCMCTLVHIHTDTHECIGMWLCVCLYICIYVRVWAYVHTCTHTLRAFAHICIDLWMRALMNTRMSARIFTCLHIHMYAYKCEYCYR